MTGLNAEEQQRLLLQTIPPAAEGVANMVGGEFSVATVPPAVESTTGTAGRTSPDILICLPLSGGLAARLIVQLSAAGAQELASQLLGGDQELPFTELALSALKEFGNILASGLVTEFQQQFSLSCRLHSPQFVTTLPACSPEPAQVWLYGNGRLKTVQVKVALYPVA